MTHRIVRAAVALTLFKFDQFLKEAVMSFWFKAAAFAAPFVLIFSPVASAESPKVYEAVEAWAKLVLPGPQGPLGGFTVNAFLVAKSPDPAQPPGVLGVAGWGVCLSWDTEGNCTFNQGYSCYRDPVGNPGSFILPDTAFNVEATLKTARITQTFTCNDPGSSTLAVDLTWISRNGFFASQNNFFDGTNNISEHWRFGKTLSVTGTFIFNGVEHPVNYEVDVTHDNSRGFVAQHTVAYKPNPTQKS
jgi:hypothetical protein